MTTRYSIIIVI